MEADSVLGLFLKGIIIGFAIAAPVGPIGILCIQRSLHDGFKVGLMTGLGAALADGTYGLIAGFGLTAVSSFLVAHQFWIRIVGGIFLLYLGIKLILVSPQSSKKRNYDNSPWHAFGSTFVLTLSNPATILSFIAIFAGMGLGTISPNFASAVVFVSGIIFGSAAWWLILSGGVAFVLHHMLGNSSMRVINWFSGAIIILFGIYALSDFKFLSSALALV